MDRLVIPKTLSPTCLYSRSAKLGLPFTELKEEVRAAKVKNLVILEEPNERGKWWTLVSDTPKEVEKLKLDPE